jgi:quinoprotein dehydrogenase-associated probable ABC transporter substrate-binding protein
MLKRARCAKMVAVLACVAALHPVHAQQTPDLASQTAFRVCADPHNLPFSNQQGEGFENKIAALLAQDLSLPLEYTWFPDSQGFVRATLMQHRCDVVMGTVAGVEDMATTSPYYHTSYVMVTRLADHVQTSKVSDWKLAGRRFGLVAGTPPTDLIVQHNLMDQTSIYALMVDTRLEQPAVQMVKDVAAGRVDVGLVWGPIAGYTIKQGKLALRVTTLDPEDSKVRLDYHIAIGVRPGDVEFRRRLNTLLIKDHAKIQAILAEYDIPSADDPAVAPGHGASPSTQ